MLDAELLQGIDRGLDEGASLVLLADVDAIQKEGQCRASNSTNGITIYGLRSNRHRVSRGGQQSGPGRELGKLVEAPAVQRQVHDLAVGNYLAYRCIIRVEQRRLPGDLDGGGRLPDSQREIFAGNLSYLDFHPGTEHFREA